LRDALELVDTLSFRSQAQKHELSELYEARLRKMGNAGRNGGEYYTPRPHLSHGAAQAIGMRSTQSVTVDRC
jgi:type I restriction-modification system DNA methylase subunit